MKLNFFKGKEVLEETFGNFRIYKAVFNAKDCTKVAHNVNITKEDIHVILQQLKTANKTFLPPIYRITTHSFFTKRLIPYTKMVVLTRQYKKYIFHVIKQALEWLHENGIEHVNLSLDSIFIDEKGNPCIADIINMRLAPECKNEEMIVLDGLCKKETNQSIHNLDDFEIFLRVEEFLGNIKTSQFENKLICLEEIEIHKKELPQFVKQNIFNCLILFLEEDVEKEQKLEILNYMKEFDNELFKKHQVALFRIIDYNVRMYMLTAIESIERIDECAEEIALGIRVKEKPLRLETLAFVFKYDKKFSKKSFGFFLMTMADCALDVESIDYVCERLLENDRFYLATSPIVNKSASCEFLKKNKKEHKEYAKIMYKTLLAFLKTKKCKKNVYACFLKYFTAFDKVKIASELLPFLCGKLTEKTCQEDCFLLVEKIVQYLKENRKDIEQTEWSYSSAKDMFLNKQEKQEHAFQSKIAQIKNKDGVSEEWEDQDVYN